MKTFEEIFSEIKKIYSNAKSYIDEIWFFPEKLLQIIIKKDMLYNNFTIRFETECRNCGEYYEGYYELFESQDINKIIKVAKSFKKCKSEIQNLEEMLKLIKLNIDSNAILYGKEILCNLDMPYSSQILIGNGYFYQTNEECDKCEKQDTFIFPLEKYFNLSRIYNIIKVLKECEDEQYKRD